MARPLRSCLLFGCLALPLLAVGGCFLFWGLAQTLDAPPPEREAATVEPVLPLVAPGDPETDELVRPGTVRLDVAMTSIDIRPGREGEPLRVEADYDRALFAFEEVLVEDDDGWVYEIRLDRKGSWFRFMGGHVEIDNRLVVVLPPDHPLAIVGKISMAESDIELGGLWLTDLDLELGAGEHELSVSDPLQRPMARFVVDSSFGDVSLYRIGNASPAVVDVEHSAGSLRIDLEGRWLRDAEVDVRFGFGECAIDLPRDVDVVPDSIRVSLGERRVDVRPPTGDGPTLHLSATGTAGELRIR